MPAAMPRRFAGTKSASQQHIGGRFDLRSALFTTALGTGVLATASLWSADAAQAGCVDVSILTTPNTVLCDQPQTTIDLTDIYVTPGLVATGNNDRRHHSLNDPDNTVVTITPGGLIDGFGLAVTTTVAGAAITVDHQGAISVNAGNNPTQGGTGVFNLTTNGGTITYTGNGSVIDNDGGNLGLVIDTGAGAGNIIIGTAISPVVPNYQGTTALRTNSGTGNQDIFLDGGSLVATDNLGAGLYATSTTGNIAIDLTGNTAITTTVAAPNGATGVRADSAGGSVTISSDANIGSAGFEFARGISSTSSAGTAIDITQTGGTVQATDFGIYAETSGANTGISVTTDAGSLIDMLGGTGIFANQLGTSGGVTVTVDGDISGADIGVDAAIANALNGDNVGVSASGSVHAVTGSSIRATTVGTGNANVTLASGTDLQGGVLAESTTGNASIIAGDNVTVVGNSPGAASITAGGNATQVWGDNAAVSGSSGLVVD